MEVPFGPLYFENNDPAKVKDESATKVTKNPVSDFTIDNFDNDDDDDLLEVILEKGNETEST